MEQGYLAQVQALIDQKWKENPEEMKRVMAEIEAKEKQKAKTKTPKQVSFDPQLTQELIEEMNKNWREVDMSKLQDLIERGADMNAKNNGGETPLYLACARNAFELAKLFIDRGADVRAKIQNGDIPLHVACEMKAYECAKLLIDAGADVMAKAGFGDRWTPLHRASSNHAFEIVKLLIEKGADVEAKDDRGKTPLHVAHNNKMKTLLRKYMK
jgi:ankyrin repeat protein